jgi:hypothetical protein
MIDIKANLARKAVKAFIFSLTCFALYFSLKRLSKLFELPTCHEIPPLGRSAGVKVGSGKTHKFQARFPSDKIGDVEIHSYLLPLNSKLIWLPEIVPNF